MIPPSSILAPLALIASSVSTGCIGDDDPEPVVLVAELELDASEGLRSYAWDDGPPIPAEFQRGSLRLEFGEAGLDGATLVYMPFSAETLSACSSFGRIDHGGSKRSLDSTLGAGRFGRGLELATDHAFLELEGAEEHLLGEAWTVEFWMRGFAAFDRAAPLLEIAGALSLRLDRRGHVVARLEGPEPLVLTSKVAVEDGEWHRIGVSLNDPELPQARLVVDREPVGASVGGRTFGRGEARLMLGGGFQGSIDDLRVLARPSSSAELIERFEFAPSAGPHTLALETSEGRRSLELWAGALTPRRLEGAAALRRGALDHVWVQGERLRWAEGAWRELEPARRPLARTTHPTVFLGEHLAFIFGGETRDTHLPPMVNTDDTWLFHTDSGDWERLATECAPSPRCHQWAAYSPDHDLVLLAGGFRNDAKLGPRFGSGTWVFHVRERRWELRTPSGNTLREFSDAPLVYHQRAKRFVLFIPGQPWTYDPEADRWEALPAAPVVPDDLRAIAGAGASSTAVYDPESGKILLFGGMTSRDGEQVFNGHTLRYDLERNEFEILTSPRAPSKRVRPGFALDPSRHRAVLFGGVLDQFSRRMEDLWSLDVHSGEWTEHLASNPPSRRGGFYGMAYDPELDRYFLLCGRNDVERFLDESWSLTLDPAAHGTATYVFDRVSEPGPLAFEARWLESVPDRLAIELETSLDGRTWRPAPTQGEIPGERYLKARLRFAPAADGRVSELSSVELAPGSPAQAQGPGLLTRAVAALR